MRNMVRGAAVCAILLFGLSSSVPAAGPSAASFAEAGEGITQAAPPGASTTHEIPEAGSLLLFGMGLLVVSRQLRRGVTRTV